MLRASLINGIGINLDADISKHIETLTDPGVFEGFIIANNNTIGPGKAWVQATRSNGETVFVYVEMKSEFSFSLTDGKIWLEIGQEAIDNGLLNNEDWSGIASIKTWPTLPSQNFLLLATVTAGVVKDERNLIPKVGELAEKLKSLDKAWITEKLKNVDTLTTDMKQIKKDVAALKTDTVSAWEPTVVFSGSKTGNSTEQRQVVCPRKSLCRLTMSVSSDRVDRSAAHIKIMKDGKTIGSCAFNQSGENPATSTFLIPAGNLTLELYSWNYWGWAVTMSYSISMQ